MSDQDPIKTVLRRMPYGIYVLSTRTDEDVNAMVVTWVTQVSFEPRLLAVAVEKSSYSYSLLQKGRVFALNLYLKEDQDLIKAFTRGRAKKADKMETARYQPGPQTGCPILEEAAAYLECRLIHIFETGGDHNLALGEVIGAGEMKEGQAEDTLSLLTLGWSYAG
jgi:flavin reductase (DIM6/NTAB) family NADH-FMN oxidoreductase RutF